MDGRRPGEPSYGRGIVEEVGQGFLLGGAFSSAFHFLRGIRNPTAAAAGGRLASAASAVRSNAPRRAGSAAVFFGLYYAFDRAVVLARRKEDRWNTAAAFAGTMGVLSMRQGACTAIGCALFGGATGVLLDGAVHVLANCVSVTQPVPPTAASRRPPGPDAPVPGHPGGFFGIPPEQPIVVEELPETLTSGFSERTRPGAVDVEATDRVADSQSLRDAMY